MWIYRNARLAGLRHFERIVGIRKLDQSLRITPHNLSGRIGRQFDARPIAHPALQGPYRVLDIFDPRRVALLLLGGDKTGDDRWYEKNVPLADQLYDNYLSEIEEEDDAKDDRVQ
jgi:hypothetical protein